MKKGIRNYITTFAPIILILVLAFAFPYKVHFENALTTLPATDFEVKISLWRIVFEPFLGPLLFFNRSLYALRELPLALLWLLILYLIWICIKTLMDKRKRKTLVLNQLLNLPLL